MEFISCHFSFLALFDRNTSIKAILNLETAQDMHI